MREILFRAKRIDNGEWVEGYYCKWLKGERIITYSEKETDCIITWMSNGGMSRYEVNPETLCQFTGLCDKKGNKIWENDILMCHGNPKDLVKAAFGEFGVRNIETGSIVDKVIGWYYEIIPTDAISRCEPFCWPMPLTKDYIDRCEMEVVGNIFDNPDLLQEELNE